MNDDSSLTPPAVVCLLPVRNGSEHLDRWFPSVATFADVVVALDDGSTDDTYDRLRTQPLVDTILRNPVREDFHGWNDAENRQRLLDACAAYRPRWVMQLDADEEIDPDDGAALREFSQDDRDHGVDALAFPVHRMIGSADRWDRIDNTPTRMFRWRSGLRLPTEELHLAPVPISIPSERIGVSTVRIRHHAGIDETSRRARYDKYSQVDPDRVWQPTYEHLLEEPTDLREWTPRRAALPVVRNHHWRASADGRSGTAERGHPDMSVLAVESAGLEQATEPAATEGSTASVEIVTANDSDPSAISTSLAGCQGEVVYLLPHRDRITLAADQRIEAHREGWAMVTGTVTNTNTSAVGWATYFIDHNQVLPGRPSSPLPSPPDECSWRRDVLQEVLDESMTEPEINRALFALGYGAYRMQEVEICNGSPAGDLRSFVRHHYTRRRRPTAHIHTLHEQRRAGKITRLRVVRSFLGRSRGHARLLTEGLRRWGSPTERRRAVALAPVIAVGYAAEFIASWVAYRSLVNG